MIALVAIALQSSFDPTASTMIAEAASKLAVSNCTGTGCEVAPKSRFRIDRTANTDPTAKDRAFADDGTYCGVLGDKRCTSTGRPVLTAPLISD